MKTLSEVRDFVRKLERRVAKLEKRLAETTPPPPQPNPAPTPTPAPPPPAPPPVTVPAEPKGSMPLKPSDRVVVDRDNQVVEGLAIKTTDGTKPAIFAHRRAGLVIRNCSIRHAGGRGIQLEACHAARIENVAVENLAAPPKGQSVSPEEVNVHVSWCHDLLVKRVLVRRGSSGFWILESNNSQLEQIEGEDFRGPFPRGQLIQWNKCQGALLMDFSCVNDPSTSWVEDNISAYESPRTTIRRGLIDGNNSPSGVGIMFERSDDGLVEDVDAVRQGNGCFSAYPAARVTFRRSRGRDTIGADQGRGKPMSGGLIFAAHPASSDIKAEDCKYWNHNRSQYIWDESRFVVRDIKKEEFQPRDRLRLTFPWE